MAKFGTAQWWRNHGGPYSSPEANALHHLKRFNFQIDPLKKITAPLGYELNAEDRSAVIYLVNEWGYTYQAGLHDASKPIKWLGQK